MVEYEDPDFKASKFPPNPNEITYWIDLTTDKYGNVIRTYQPEEKRWIPLNRDVNADQYGHFKQLAKTLGFLWDPKDEDIIELPDFSEDHYFTGDDMSSIIKTGDEEVYTAITNETKRATAKEHALDLILGKHRDKIAELVKLLGFTWESQSDYKPIKLPDYSKNTYFKTGATLTELIKGGDEKVKDAITQETHDRTTIDTQIQKSVKDLSSKYDTLKQSYDTLQSSYTKLLKEVAELKSQIQTAAAQVKNYQNLLDLNKE